MASACCCTRRYAASNCGSGGVRKSPPSFVIWSRTISQNLEPEYRCSAGVHCYVVPAGDQPITVQRSALSPPFVAVAMVVAACLYAIAQRPLSPTRVRGTIEGVDGDMLAVKSRAGEDFRLRMTADIRGGGMAKISLSDIKVGSFIGTTTVPGA